MHRTQGCALGYHRLPFQGVCSSAHRSDAIRPFYEFSRHQFGWHKQPSQAAGANKAGIAASGGDGARLQAGVGTRWRGELVFDF
jgi:hypothetical protein